jgi:4-amino-4-deoxy-L-arabinose transferase-like glycosyltransferase
MTSEYKFVMNPFSLIKDKPLLIILLFSFILRLLCMWLYPEQNFPDANAYKAIGKEIFAGNTITNNIYMPLYPILTYLTGGSFFQILMDIFLSVLIVWLIYLVSFAIFDNRPAAILSSFVAAAYPHFIFYSISGLSEIFFTFLLLLSFLFFYRKRFFLAIIVSILAVLVRPTFDLINPILVILFIGIVHELGWKKISQYTLIYFISYVVIMSPWWMHQYQKYGDFVRLNLGDGIVLYSGNNPLNTSGGGVGRENGLSDMDLSRFSHIKNPIERNQLMKKEALDYIMNNPGRFIELAGTKFIRFWRLWPYTEHYQQWYIILASLLSYGTMLTLSIGYIIRNSRRYFRKITPILSLSIYLTLVHMATIGSLRYRLPLEPFLIIFAGYFFVDVFKSKQWFINIINKFNIETSNL